MKELERQEQQRNTKKKAKPKIDKEIRDKEQMAIEEPTNQQSRENYMSLLAGDAEYSLESNTLSPKTNPKFNKNNILSKIIYFEHLSNYDEFN